MAKRLGNWIDLRDVWFSFNQSIEIWLKLMWLKNEWGLHGLESIGLCERWVKTMEYIFCEWISFGKSVPENVLNNHQKSNGEYHMNNEDTKVKHLGFSSIHFNNALYNFLKHSYLHRYNYLILNVLKTNVLYRFFERIDVSRSVSQLSPLPIFIIKLS